MGSGFTRYQLRQQANNLNIAVRYRQINDFIACGALPDPDVTPWREDEIVPRFLRLHELGASVWSLPRRVVILWHERFPVEPDKLQAAMAAMLPTIRAPQRKKARIERALAWKSSRNRDGGGVKPSPPRPPGRRGLPRSAWREIIEATPLDVFANKVGVVPYFALLLRQAATGTRHDLTDIAPEELLTLFTVRELAGWHHTQQQARAEWDQDSTAQDLPAGIAVPPVGTPRGRTATERQIIQDLASAMERA